MALTGLMFSNGNIIYAVAYGIIMSLLTSFFICWGYRHQIGASIILPVHSFCDNCEKPINLIYTLPVIGTILCKGVCKKCNFIYPKMSFIFELISLVVLPIFFILYDGVMIISAITIFWCISMFTISSTFN